MTGRALLCGATASVHIYPQDTRRSCLVCGLRKPFDPGDYVDPWPSWAGLTPGDHIRVRHASNDTPWPAIVASTHRGGALVEVIPPDGAGVEVWKQFVMADCGDGTYAR